MLSATALAWPQLTLSTLDGPDGSLVYDKPRAGTRVITRYMDNRALIDVAFDFRSDTQGYPKADPDARSPTLRTINAARGFHPKIKDRFDLTVECIRRHYRNECSPLQLVLERYSSFFNLFKGEMWTNMWEVVRLPERTVCLAIAMLVGCPAGSLAQVQPDTVLEVLEIGLGTARLGENSFEIRVRNRSDVMVTALLDLRAVPGMWLLPSTQKQFPKELAPGEEGVIEGTFEFRRLSPEATLRVTVGPGEPRDGGFFGFRGIDFQRVFDVGRTSPDAYDPAEYFTISRHGPLEIYTWKGSLAERHLDAIAAERLGAIEAIEQLLGVEAPERIRIVFYPDEPHKIEQTGHQGRGWAWGTILVEVYSEDVQLDPYHELVHVIANALGSPPPILNEGLAVYASELLGADALRLLGFPNTPVHRAVCEIRQGSTYIPLADLLALDNIGSQEDRAAREYAQAGSFVGYLVERRGVDRFREAYSHLSARANIEENIRRLQQIYGMRLSELESAWLREVEHLCVQSS